jgi:hypothetical protein
MLLWRLLTLINEIKTKLIMDWKQQLNKRISYNITVPNYDYFLGIVPLLEFLINDLEKFLDQEGRCYGVMVAYIHKTREILKNIRRELEEGDETTWKRIVFLYKPVILREYKKFLRRKITKADAIICIIRKALEVILTYAEDDMFDKFNSIYIIFNKMYVNIKNKGKEYSLPMLSSTIDGSICEGLVGLHKLDKFSIVEEENKRRAKNKIDGSGIRIKETSSDLISEISWIDE